MTVQGRGAVPEEVHVTVTQIGPLKIFDDAPVPRQVSGRIGVWQLQDGTALVRQPVADEPWHFWADVDRLVLDPASDKVVLLGESVARGYFFDPAYHPAGLLAGALDHVLGKRRAQVIDLARTNARLSGVVETLAQALQLHPRVVVIWAGNNWSPMEALTPAVAHDVAARCEAGATAHQLRDHLVGLHRKRTATLLDRARELLDAAGVTAVWVVPEFHLAGWYDPAPVPPPLGRERRDQWQRCREEVLAAAAGRDPLRASAVARELTRIDQGLGSLGPLVAARAVMPQDPALARRLFEQARDAELWPKSPRLHASSVEELRRVASSSRAAAIVDLPEVLASWGGGPLPTSMFLDYCHHSEQGLRIAAAAIAQQVLEHGFDIARDGRGLVEVMPRADPAVRARAHFLAALHNAAHDQPAEVVRDHLHRSLRSDPEVVVEMVEYTRSRTLGVPALLASGHRWSPQLERYLGAGGALRPHLDVELARLVCETPGLDPESYFVSLIENHQLDTTRRDLLAPEYAHIVAMDETTLEHCAFRRYRRAIARFLVILGGPSDVELELTVRAPSPAGACHIRMNGELAGSIRLYPAWTQARVVLPAAASRRGVNVIAIDWPASTLDEPAILGEYAQALRHGDTPCAPYPVLGEIFRLDARRVSADGRA